MIDKRGCDACSAGWHHCAHSFTWQLTQFGQFRYIHSAVRRRTRIPDRFGKPPFYSQTRNNCSHRNQSCYHLDERVKSPVGVNEAGRMGPFRLGINSLAGCSLVICSWMAFTFYRVLFVHKIQDHAMHPSSGFQNDEKHRITEKGSFLSVFLCYNDSRKRTQRF